MGSSKSYFDTDGVAILAHRGLTTSEVHENTLAAFELALAAGATHIETDVQATSDGVAVLFHDSTLFRVFGDRRKVSQLSFEALLGLGGYQQRIPTLREALERFPEARFNIDVKTIGGVEPVVQAVLAAAAGNRVLLSSFSGRRRKTVLRRLASFGVSVATSAHALLALRLLILSRLSLRSMFDRVARGLDAIQVPVRQAFLRFDHPKFVADLKRSNVELHYWTINDAGQMQRLVALGANGIVTDRADLAQAVLLRS